MKFLLPLVLTLGIGTACAATPIPPEKPDVSPHESWEDDCLTMEETAFHFLALYKEAEILRVWDNEEAQSFINRFNAITTPPSLIADELIAFGNENQSRPVLLYFFRDGCYVFAFPIPGAMYRKLEQDVSPS